MESRIGLPQLASRLRPYLGDQTPGYRQLSFMLHDGVFSMENAPGRRGYFAPESSLPAIAEAVRSAMNKGRRKLAA